ncbi:hypothetical protein D3C71_1096150 [compost metagenome]
MVGRDLDEMAYRGEGPGSERRRQLVGIPARDILKCLCIHRLEDWDQRAVRPGPHEAGDRRVFHCSAVVLRREGCDLSIDTMMQEFSYKNRTRLFAPAEHLLAPVRPKRRDLDIWPEPICA